MLRVRWLGNACVEVKGAKHVVIDPNFIVEPEGRPEIILVTHEHEDHFKRDALKYRAEIYAPKSAIGAFKLKATEVKEGMVIGGYIEVVKSFCWKSRLSVGYLIKDEYRVLHLGDSFRSERIQTDVIFVPTFKDYHDEILDMVRACEAKLAVPVHYDYFRYEKLEVAKSLVRKLINLGVNSFIVKPGDWIAVEEVL